MLSTNIDLTEHGDFRGSSLSNFILLDSTISIDEMYEQQNMSFDEFEIIEKYEAAFGKRHCTTQFHEIFDKSFYEQEKEMEVHCQRCGKYLPFKWQRFNWFCKECDYTVNNYDSDGNRKMPWEIKNFIEPMRFDDRDDLNLR